MTPNPNPSPELQEALERLTRAVKETLKPIVPPDRHRAVLNALANAEAALSPQTLPAPGEVEWRDRVKAVSERLLIRMREYARQDGWALAVHGSMCRDLDVIAVPWTDTASDTGAFVEAMRAAVASELGGTAIIGAGEDGRTAGFKFKPNGRRCYTLHSTSEELVEDETGAHPYVDLSVMDMRGNPNTIAFVQDWLMNADYDSTQFDKDFAAAIDARSLATVAAANDDNGRVRQEAHVRGWKHGLEDAAKVADNLCADMTAEANEEPAGLTSTLHRASAQTAGKIAAAIRLLSQGGGEVMMRTDLSGKIIGSVLLVATIIAGVRHDAFGALFLGFFSGANFFATSRSQHEGAGR